jgi:hypothetical protein
MLLDGEERELRQWRNAVDTERSHDPDDENLDDRNRRILGTGARDFLTSE